MGKPVYDVSDLYREADEAAEKVEYKQQYGIPDFEAKLKAAYVHGWVDCLQKHKVYPPKLYVPKK